MIYSKIKFGFTNLSVNDPSNIQDSHTLGSLCSGVIIMVKGRRNQGGSSSSCNSHGLTFCPSSSRRVEQES